MTENPTTVSDIQAILDNLKEEIRQHRLTLGDAMAEPADPMAQVRQFQRVNSHLPIGWPVMPKGIAPKLVAYTQKVVRRLLRWYINPLVDQQNQYNAAVTEVLQVLVEQSGLDTESQRLSLQRVEALVQALDDQVAQLQTFIDQRFGQTSEHVDASVRELRQVVDTFVRETAHDREVNRLRLQRLENWRRENASSAQPAAPQEPGKAPGDQPSATFDYYLLGLLYRSEQQMQTRMADYDDLFQTLVSAEPKKPVLDIGCGRGEFVAHLQELGLKAYGIDLYRDAIAIGQEAGRDVRLADATAHLKEIPDASLAAISMIQVIEHFAIDDLLRLLQIAARKLMPGGFILAETINPQCLAIMARFYVLDPSHRMPLHPDTTRFLMEQAGLARVETRFLHPVPDSDRLELISQGAPGLREPLNRNLEKLNAFLYGTQDYAVIAYRPED
jgi:2-polyprenyl-3-methyl-5-hydroxy-6-metoxy-1,4-benzoquinol methylase